jgi:hypothetical protein
LPDDVFNTGKPFMGNELHITPIRNGQHETYYANFVYKPLYNNEHIVDGVISVAADVTGQVIARKKIEESEERFRLQLAN